MFEHGALIWTNMSESFRGLSHQINGEKRYYRAELTISSLLQTSTFPTVDQTYLTYSKTEMDIETNFLSFYHYINQLVSSG